MRRKLGLVIAALILWRLPAAAIPFGVPDDNGHPYVGIIVFYDAGGTPLWRCTGTLISSTVVLTAAHCAEPPAARAQVWFDEIPAAPPYPYSGGVMGIPHPHPSWTGHMTWPDTHDVGVVVLDFAVNLSTYGQLPDEGVLDALVKKLGLQDVTLKVVGYGLQGIRPEYLSLRQRFVGWTRLVNLKSALTDGYNIQFSNNPGHWSGGICSGDSGGPVFLGNTNIVVGVISFVLNQNCKGTGFGYRVDIPDTRDFLDDYVTLP